MSAVSLKDTSVVVYKGDDKVSLEVKTDGGTIDKPYGKSLANKKS